MYLSQWVRGGHRCPANLQPSVCQINPASVSIALPMIEHKSRAIALLSYRILACCLATTTRMNALVDTIRNCSHAMEASLEAVKKLKASLAKKDLSVVDAAIAAEACESLIEVLRYNPENAHALMDVCGCFAVLTARDAAVKVLSEQGGLDVILESYRFVTNSQLNVTDAEKAKITAAVKPLLPYAARAEVSIASFLSVPQSGVPRHQPDLALAVLEKLGTRLESPIDASVGCDLLSSFINVPPSFADPDDNSLAELVQTLIDKGVLTCLAALMHSSATKALCMTSVLNLLTYLADQDESQAAAVASSLGRHIANVLSLHSSGSSRESAYAGNLCLLLLCRFASIDESMTALVSSAETSQRVLRSAVDMLHRILSDAGASGSNSSTHDRHAFGLCIALLLCLTNTSDEREASLIASQLCSHTEEHGFPKVVVLLLGLVLRCENKLLLATLNILCAICADTPTASALIRLSGWSVLLSRMRELTADALSDMREESSIVSDITDFEASSQRGRKVLGQILQTLTLISSSSLEAPALIFSTVKVLPWLPESIIRLKVDVVNSSVSDLLTCADVLLVHGAFGGEVGSGNASMGVNALTILYNLALEKSVQVILSKDDASLKLLLGILSKYLPGTSVLRVSSSDRLDVSTLILGTIARAIGDYDGELDKDPRELIETLFEHDIVASMAAVARVCDEIVYPDLILFQIKILKAISDHGKCHAQLLTAPYTSEAISAITDMLNAEICSSAPGLSMTLQLLELLLVHTSASQPEIPQHVVSFLMSFRVGSPHALNSKVIDVLSDILVVGEPAMQ